MTTRSIASRSRPGGPHPWLPLLLLSALAVLPLALALPPSRAQEAPTPAAALLPDGQWGGAYQALALSPDGRTAYLGQGARLWTLDLGDGRPGTLPRSLSLSPLLPGPLRDLALVGDRLYAAGQTGGVWAMDLSDPARPRMLGHDPGIPTVVNMVADAGHRVYMARGAFTITLADFTDPASPQPLACAVFEDGAGVWDVASSGDMIYLAMRDGGLRSMDLKDPMLPMLRGSLAAIEGQPLFATAVVQEAGLVLVGDGPRLQLIDWRDADHPRPLATLPFPEQDLKTLSIRGQTAFALAQAFIDGGLWLHRVDLSRPAAPRLAQSWLLGVPEEGLGAEDGYAVALAQVEDRLAVAAGSLGLRVFLAPAEVDESDWSPGSSFLAAPWAEGIDPDSLLAAAGSAGLWALAEPVAGSEAAIPPVLAQDSPGQALASAGRAATGDTFLADGSGGLRWYRRGPAAGGLPLTELAALDALPAPRRLALPPVGDAVFVADPLSGLHQVRALTAEADGPRLEDLGTLDLGADYPEDLAITADPPRLWVAHGSGVSAFDLDGDGQPRLLARIPLSGFAGDVDIGPGGLVAVAGGMAGLSLLRPDGAGGWSLWRRVATPGDAQQVALGHDGRRVFVADLSGSVLAYDVSTDPPTLLGSFSLPFPVVDLDWDAGDALWIASRAGGIYRLHLGDPPPPTITPTPRRTPMAHDTPGAPLTPAARLHLPRLVGGSGMADSHP